MRNKKKQSRTQYSKQQNIFLPRTSSKLVIFVHFMISIIFLSDCIITSDLSTLMLI